MLPSDDAFVAAEAGVRLFPLTFRTTGNQTVTATDVAARSITGSEAVSVTPRPFYVANFNGNSATVYAAGATGNATPIATIAGSNTGLTSPQGIAVDAAGRLYVANIANPYTITIYASGATGNATPAATIAGSNTGLSQPEGIVLRSEEHTSELQSHLNLVCRLLLEKKKKTNRNVDVVTADSDC